ncbi:hypothetical protein DMA11_05640 [Marinilabiliaceae bacterium JC017]|nr:hypothetical protein DMA11_05640 [Marinilabiliaceae bacterium JC017]
MKTLKSIFVASLFVLGLGFTACSDDEEVTPTGPSVVVPDGVVELAPNATKDLTFIVKAPGGFASASFETAGGTFAINLPIEEGATSGEITGIYTAGEETGPGAVTLTVTDKNGKTATGAIGIEISLEN